jgi:hypothetical protein
MKFQVPPVVPPDGLESETRPTRLPEPPERVPYPLGRAPARVRGSPGETRRTALYRMEPRSPLLDSHPFERSPQGAHDRPYL